MDVTFLLGAGVSVAVGMPTTRQITEAVLANDDFVRHSDGRVLFDADKTVPTGGVWDQRAEMRQHVLPWQRLLRTVREQMKELIRDSQPTYEDLYYVVETLWRDSGSVERDPLVEALWRFLEPALPCDLRAQLNCIRSEGISDFQLDPDSYVRGAVADYLKYHQDKVTDLSDLRLFSDAAGDGDVNRLHIFTLNHDTLFERFLREQAIFDGLGGWDGDFRWLDVEGYMQEEAGRIRLVKLHGSLDWRWYGSADTNPSRCGVNRISRLYGMDGRTRCWKCGLPSPAILVGTVNKFRFYQYVPFLDLVYLFHACLARASRLVVCGHSFCDEGIKAHVMNWVRSDVARGVLIIDPNAAELKRKLVDIDINEAGIQTMECGIEKVEWQAVKDWLSA